MEPWAIYRGYHGLIRGELEPLTSRSVSGIIQRGGTILKSASFRSVYDPGRQRQAAATLEQHEIEALIVIGGDGSFKGALELDKLGIKVIGIPATSTMTSPAQIIPSALIPRLTLSWMR